MSELRIFWNPESTIWKQIMKENAMTEFTIVRESTKGKITKLVLGMDAAIGPDHSDVTQFHRFQTIEKSDGMKIYVNKIRSKTYNFPYADYFDIIER
jgi:hypothetical protein